MLRQLDPEAVPPSLLGAVLSVLIRATESMPEYRQHADEIRDLIFGGRHLTGPVS